MLDGAGLTVEKLVRIARHGEKVTLDPGTLGIEFMAAAQALDLRNFSPGRGVQVARGVIRRHVDYLEEDRSLYPDHNKMKALVESCAALDEAGKMVGSPE